MLSEFELEDGQRVWFRSYTGRVVEAAKSSETSIYSRSEALTTVSGITALTDVRSVTDRAHSIWLRSDDGSEHEVILDHHDFGTRTGHEVTVLWGAADGQQHGSYMGAVNHTTGNVWRKDLSSMGPFLKTPFVTEQNLGRGGVPRGLTAGVAICGIGVLLACRYLFGSFWSTAFITALICTAVLAVVRRTVADISHYSTMRASLQLLDAKVESLVSLIKQRIDIDGVSSIR